MGPVNHAHIAANDALILHLLGSLLLFGHHPIHVGRCGGSNTGCGLGPALSEDVGRQHGHRRSRGGATGLLICSRLLVLHDKGGSRRKFGGELDILEVESRGCGPVHPGGSFERDYTVRQSRCLAQIDGIVMASKRGTRLGEACLLSFRGVFGGTQAE